MNTVNYISILEYAARIVPDKPFLLLGEKAMTYGQIENQANRFANALTNLGIAKGDHVALLMPNIPQLVSSLAAIAKIGAVAIPLHPATPGAAVARLLVKSESKVLVAFEAFLGAAQEGKVNAPICENLIVVRFPGSPNNPDGVLLFSEMVTSASGSFTDVHTKADDAAVILYTSGTTGQPKGVVHSHNSLFYSIQQISNKVWGLTPEDVALLAASPSTIFAHTIIWGTAMNFGSMTSISKFDLKDFLQLIQDHKVTFFAGVPTIAHYMLHVPFVDQYDLSSLEKIFFGGAALPLPLIKAFEQKFNVKLSSGYGMTEGVPFCYIHSDELNAIPNAVGRPSPGITMRIIDEEGQVVPAGMPGEITVRGPQLFSGYFHAPEINEKSFRDGWFHTSDIGKIDESGYVFLIDRLNNMIKRSGYKVYSAEVEQILMHHEAVAQAAVIGVPDEAIGEEIKAFVVLKPEAQTSAEDLIAFCKSQMEAYKYPRIIEFRKQLPMTAAGKLSHHTLRAEHADS